MTDFKGKIRKKESAKNEKLLLNYALGLLTIGNFLSVSF